MHVWEVLVILKYPTDVVGVASGEPVNFHGRAFLKYFRLAQSPPHLSVCCMLGACLCNSTTYHGKLQLVFLVHSTEQAHRSGEWDGMWGVGGGGGKCEEGSGRRRGMREWDRLVKTLPWVLHIAWPELAELRCGQVRASWGVVRSELAELRCSQVRASWVEVWSGQS